MYIQRDPSHKYPSDKRDIIADELSRIYAVVASYIENNEYIIQITIGNQLPQYDDVRLLKLFICNDDIEMQNSLAMLFQDRNQWASRLFQ